MAVIDNKKIKHILISRADAIGDVVLTLPVAGYCRELFQGATISFLGKTYTGPVIESCSAVDHFINYDELKALPETEQAKYLAGKKIDAIIHVFPNKHIAALAKRAGIKLRVGTTNRPYHWLTCNKLVKLSRKKSNLHEAQLNLKLLEPFGLNYTPTLPEVVQHYNFKAAAGLPQQFKDVLNSGKFIIILHPKSHGSGVEWGLDKFAGLIAILPEDKFNIIITGSDKEKALLNDWIALQADVVDMTGKMTLAELIAFISCADGLVASGTGPLHLAAALGIHALGLFPCTRPIHPGRWAPVGKKAEYIESNAGDLESISAADVYKRIQNWVA